MRRARSARNPIISGINIGVFNLVMLVVALCLLLLQFLSAPPFHYALGLPTAKHSIWMPEADRPGAIVIQIDGGRILYRGDRVLIPILRTRLLEDLRHGSDQKIYLSVEENMSYRSVKEVIACLQSVGIQRIAFLCKPSVL